MLALRGIGRSLQSSRIWAAAGVRFASTSSIPDSTDPKHFIDASKLQITPTSQPRPKYKDKTSLLFGHQFTDHMLEVEWNSKEGWGAPKISAYHNLSLPPSATVFHYALECFEGFKAYKDVSDPNKVRLFRPIKNMERLNDSCRRLLLPQFNKAGLMDCVRKLISLDSSWIPVGKGYSLYIRPTVIGTEYNLGVGASSTALLFVILSPVGPYYPTGFKPVKLLADDKNVRAWPGGSGASKLGANYAPTIQPQSEAAKKGLSQILWLLNDNVTEVGTMNFFVFMKNKQGKPELITPPLDGTILPGVTRDSVLQLARQWKEFDVVERPLSIHDLVTAIKENRVIEAFGAGTAAIVCPISGIQYKGVDYEVPIDSELSAGKLSKRFADTIMGIQYGEIASEWSEVLQ